MAFASLAAKRGHAVTLFEADKEIGGQFNMAKKVPGKEEFYETIRYFKKQIEITGVNLVLNKKVVESDLTSFDEVILATGISPRKISIPGAELPKVLSYIEVLKGQKVPGNKVAVIGAGGIGFDVSEYITTLNPEHVPTIPEWLEEWGIDPNNEVRGGIEGIQPVVPKPAREVVMFQRSKGKVGAKLGKTTGWIHRTNLKKKRVRMVDGVEYLKIDEEGLHYKDKTGRPEVFACDSVIICAGQTPLKDLEAGLVAAGKKVHLIGGAHTASELDAKRAIDQAARLAAII
jgi:2,4-dienoyl-CoA reductase (NADPH2)